MDKKLYYNKKSVSISIKKYNRKMILKNDKGNEWLFPSNVSEDSAIATLVYSTLLHNKVFIESFADKFIIKLEVQEIE